MIHSKEIKSISTFPIDLIYAMLCRPISAQDTYNFIHIENIYIYMILLATEYI